jgi:hypothetical protein
MKIKLEEYKSVSIEDIMNVTGLPNPWDNQDKYSLARQKELLLQAARANNLLHKVKKSHPIEYKVITVERDQGLTILTAKVVSEPKPFTSVLDLNVTPHRVVRENKRIIIEVMKTDIPDNVLPSPKGYAYEVIGIFTQEKCYHNRGLYQNPNEEFGITAKRIGTKYRFGFHSNVSLHILD